GRIRADLTPTIIVTTQTVEVGANLDFDGIVTESVSWDSLVQRLGRLNRLGNPDDYSIHAKPDPSFDGEGGADEHSAHAIVVHDNLDSIYGEARINTWNLLAQLEAPQTISKVGMNLDEGIAVSPVELRRISEGIDLGSVSLADNGSPSLLPAHLDAWVQTSPVPATDVPTAPFLHGYGRPGLEVHLVWRSDVQLDDTRGWPNAVDALPPTAGEQLTVPLTAFRRWVEGGNLAMAEDFGDIVNGESDDPVIGQDGDTGSRVQWVLRWRSAGDHDVLALPRDLGKVRAEDLLVLPAGVGGCDCYGWAPTSVEAVPDLADLASKQPTLRLTSTTTVAQTLQLAGHQVTAEEAVALMEVATVAHDAADQNLVCDLLSELWTRLPSSARTVLLHLDPEDDVEVKEPYWRVSFIDRGTGPLVLVRMVPTGVTDFHVDTRYSSDSTTEPGATSTASSPVTLVDHQRAVSERARAIAMNLALPDDVTAAVVEAAAWHDVGKLDPRFQVMLHGGDELAAEVAIDLGRPLAKSGMDPADRPTWNQAFRASRLPSGFRHEVGSAAAVARHIHGQGELDGELVVHLVGAHHGRGRPLYPPVVDRPVTTTTKLSWNGTELELDRSATIDWSGPERFATLNDRYGRWGLALLETIVRLADIGCSVEGS
ncbi:MAG: HD domain-containing protein, partial [Acidimicrobiales bacterium]